MQDLHQEVQKNIDEQLLSKYLLIYIKNKENLMALIAKVFKNGRSQAIRIPKEFRVPTVEVYIERDGEKLIIRPKYRNKWDKFFDELAKTDTSGFMKERVQLPLQSKEIV